MEGVSEVLSYKVLGAIEVSTLILSFLCILGGFFGKRLVALVLKRLVSVSKRTRFAYDAILSEALQRPLEWGVLLLGFWLAFQLLPVPTSPINLGRFVDAALMSGSIVLMTFFALRLIEGLTAHWKEKASKTETKLDDQLVPIVRSSSRAFAVIVGAILVLQNLGYSVASLVAGLGLGGAAVAFASKDTLSNLFGSLVIFLDRPFQIGDWIEVGDLEGTVEEVGLRTTRVRTFADSLLTVPNMIFTTKSINNWSQMKRRRIKVSVGVAYDTPPSKVRQAVARFREIIKADPAMHHDFFLVNMDTIGATGLEIFVYSFTITTNWVEFMNQQEKLLLCFLEALEELEIKLALPSQRLRVDGFPGEPEAMHGHRPR